MAVPRVKSKRGLPTPNVHAEKMKNLLSQKDALPQPQQKVEETANGTDAGKTGEKTLEEERDKGVDVDQAKLLLKGFDSDSEDSASDEGFDKDKPTTGLPKFKQTQKKLRQAAQTGKASGPGVVYVGRIPHGFYETEMRQYFSQFGTIARLRLSRNRKTGHSKHFAFIEFQSDDVAKIVAETMDNYLMFGHILKCRHAAPESLHPDTFKGSNKPFRTIPRNRIEKRALEAPKSETHWTKKIRREQAKREKKAERLKEMGYDMELPTMKLPGEVLQNKQVQSTEDQVDGKSFRNVDKNAEAVDGGDQPAHIPETNGAPTRKRKSKKAKSILS